MFNWSISDLLDTLLRNTLVEHLFQKQAAGKRLDPLPVQCWVRVREGLAGLGKGTGRARPWGHMQEQE